MSFSHSFKFVISSTKAYSDLNPVRHNIKSIFRTFSRSAIVSMPEQLKSSEINSEMDPSVSKQYDAETPKDQQVKELFAFIDSKKIGMLNTYRNGVGPVGRSMSVASRDGSKLLFLANKHSRKFSDLENNKEVQVAFQDSKTQDWASITGTATTVSSSDPRIKDLWSPGVKAWFGDIGDGKHDGGKEDPRITLIEVKPTYAVYWLHQVGALGFAKEIASAAMTGKVADTGVLRELSKADLERVD
ncbi:hypothetical protein GQ43DRAFT_445261 [Delitschia confertaspora ATCC 74209]|uniref:General stress protein FMN-binding split barrel domain-containing protein n=1 Tax=Delitschia confertaspora ATCC 74209 TaxID=1513339 RepID=A0A9P4JBV2_9PLEO|nr:hypothetical protein GQ43DRAFT_445261 [Delitschia confertaspora ATCC 74209]